MRLGAAKVPGLGCAWAKEAIAPATTTGHKMPPKIVNFANLFINQNVYYATYFQIN